MLRLPSACLLPNPARHEPHMLALLRNVLEDPVTLGGWMEAEIRNYFAQRARSGFLNVQRQPQVRVGPPCVGSPASGGNRAVHASPLCPV